MKFQCYINQTNNTLKFRAFPNETLHIDSLDIRLLTFEANRWINKKLANLRQNKLSIPKDEDYPDLLDDNYSSTFWCTIG